VVRFDKPCLTTSGALNYFAEHMTIGDYLSEAGKSEMVWYGDGAKMLGLNGSVRQEDFEALCEGVEPRTQERLGLRDKGSQRRVCFFGQISAPKDVSIALLVGGDQRIADWWREAVQETLSEIEASTSTRIRKEGRNEDRASGNMVAAVVTHDSSRSLDPQLHTHVCIMNVTYDPVEESWKSIQPSAYFKHQGFFREVCYNKLATRMEEAGYEIENSRKLGFVIKGFPEEPRARFSKRRMKIQEIAEQLGVTSQDGLQAIAGHSREQKYNIAPSELRKRWEEECGQELDSIRVVVSNADGRRKYEIQKSAAGAMDASMEHVFERTSVVNERILLKHALMTGRGHVSLSELRDEITRRVATNELVRLRDQIASRSGLEMEHQFTEWAFLEKDKFGNLGSFPSSKSDLSEEQEAAVQGALKSRDRLLILKGDAGTGKTTTLREIVNGIEMNGGKVFSCAPTSGATEVLRKELTPEANTLQQFLVNESLQRRNRGRVIIVDEAGVISVRQMHELCVVAKRNHNRILLVGDTKQHASVEAGDALRAMEKFGGVEVFRLRTIRRQRDPGHRKAVSLLAEGKAFAAFKQFERLGVVQEIKNQTALFEAVADKFVQAIKEGKSCLAISPVWSEIHKFTDSVRSRLKANGTLSSVEIGRTVFHPFQWTQAEKKQIQNYQPGDALLFQRRIADFRKGEMVVVSEKSQDTLTLERFNGSRVTFRPAQIDAFEVGLSGNLPVAIGDRLLIRSNDREAGLRNGDIVEVSGFNAEGGIHLKDGRLIPSEFRHFKHGYATTSHASQGKTVDCGILIMGEEGIRAGNLKQAYVSNSRFRERQFIFTTDKAAASDAMATDADRLLAMELELKRLRSWKWTEKIINTARDWQQSIQRCFGISPCFDHQPRTDHVHQAP
jgi:conjugative relaxase-like TrwC/TraI family protein